MADRPSTAASQLPLSLSTPLIPLLSHPALRSTSLGPNHLPNLAALLRPFTTSFATAGAGSGSSAGAGLLAARSLNLQTVALPGWGLRVVDFDEWEAAGQAAPGEEEVADALGSALGRIPEVNGRSDVPEGSGDGQAWRTMAGLMDVTRPEVSWETFAHPLAMIIAIPSTLHEPLVELSQLFARSRAKERFAARPWQAEELLRFIVIVHDQSSPLGSLEGAQRTLESIKKTYGPHCSLLAINSLAPALPPSPFLHEVYASQPSSDPVRALLDPSEGRRTSLRSEGLDEGDGPQGEEGIETGRRLSEVGDNEDDEPSAASLSDGSSHPLAAVPDDGPSPAVASVQRGTKLLGGRLTEDDVVAVKSFLKEFSGGSLIPYMERMVSTFNETYNSTRKGITGRLFGAGRKLWGGGDSRPSSPGLGGVGYNAIRGFYPHHAPEATNRRLADLAFLLRDYKYAASIYDGIRKDYVGDKATMYVAGASEMLGLSLLLASTGTTASAQLPLIESYYDSALATFVASPLPQLFSVRMVAAYCSLFTETASFRAASHVLVRAAGEAEEVWAAVLLQEAAEVEGQVEKLGRGGKGRARRQAGHWVEAARRFEVCGLKSFSTSCLEKALVIYRASTWTQAQFFVEHALGRQAYTMGRSDVAVEHFIRLLGLAEGQSGGWLDDFALAFQHLATTHPEKIATLPSELPQPLFDVKRTAIRSAHGKAALRRADPQWAVMEDNYLRLSNSAGGRRPAALIGDEINIVSVDEPFHVVLEISNPLDTELRLGRLTVGGDWQSSPSSAPKVAVIDEIVMEPRETREISIRVVASAETRPLTFDSVSFLFHNLFAVRQSLARRGERLHVTKAQRLTPTYAADRSLTVSVQAKRPNLVLETAVFPPIIAQGETRRVAAVLRNAGCAPARFVDLLSGGDGLVRILGTVAEAGPSTIPVYPLSKAISTPFSISNELVMTTPVAIELPGDGLAPGETMTIELLVHGAIPGLLDLRFLCVYQETADGSYFSSTACHQLEVIPVLEVSANHRPSAARTGHHLVSMEFSSLSSEPIEVTAVQMLSSAWEAVSPTGLTSLATLTASGESQRSYLQLAPRSDAAAPDRSFTAAKLQQLFSGSLDLASRPPAVELAATPTSSAEIGRVDLTSSVLQPLLLAQLSTLRRATLEAQYPLIPSVDLPAVFTLLEPRDIVLVIFFRLPGRAGAPEGHLAISNLSPGLSESLFLDDLAHAGTSVNDVKGVRSMFEQTDQARWALAESVLDGPLGREDDPVRLEVASETETVDWNFASGPCPLAVSYTLTNTSARLAACVNLTLLPPVSSALFGPALRVGPLSLKATLDPLCSTKLTSAVLACRPGLVEVEGAWRLAVETGLRQHTAAGGEEGGWVGRRSFDRVRTTEGEGRVVGVRTARVAVKGRAGDVLAATSEPDVSEPVAA